MSDIKALASGLVALGENAEYTEGRLLVLMCAVEAMLQTHPDHEAFAAAFRRSWQLAGSQHSNAEHDAQTQAGIDGVLQVIEDACSVPLNVRPTR
ncbi:hypothetical protein J4G52_25180 [Burkholderia cenocepacia]|uniref:hypothetical protein n=1 Tax=Burkholderia cenocepacia TaxID=95486 RepID=UPI001AA16E06|nr:hypothetical protein [Burkholderia cenocepacia]MBO1856836.1 hypothetical protein [Burkholderia cenocepacia]